MGDQTQSCCFVLPQVTQLASNAPEQAASGGDASLHHWTVIKLRNGTETGILILKNHLGCRVESGLEQREPEDQLGGS